MFYSSVCFNPFLLWFKLFSNFGKGRNYCKYQHLILFYCIYSNIEYGKIYNQINQKTKQTYRKQNVINYAKDTYYN